MAINKHVKAVIQLRRANESEWIALNPVLRMGEPALSKDINRLKIGDGVRNWADIPYLLETEFNTVMSLITDGMYTAGNGITIVNREISLDDLIIDCGVAPQGE